MTEVDLKGTVTLVTGAFSAVEYVVTRPAHAAVSELLIRPGESER
jgi:hypothetical protein